jgi:hypothetical protein
MPISQVQRKSNVQLTTYDITSLKLFGARLITDGGENSIQMVADIRIPQKMYT